MTVEEGHTIKETYITADCGKLKDFVTIALEHVGVTSESAQIAAEVLVTTDMRGVRSHGTRQLRAYVTHILRGGMQPKAEMQIVGDGSSWAIVDGRAGLGVVTAYKAMNLAISKSRENVAGMVGVRNSNHFGAAGYYAMMCVKEDMIGLAMSNGDPTMSAPGAAGRVLSNSPLAYAVPTGCAAPIALDIALSAVAGVKIHQAAREHRLVPKGWLVDRNGLPTTNPADFENGGAHIPIGGHKGFGLALIVEILAGIIADSGITREVTSFVQYPECPSNVGHFFTAINVAALMPIGQFKARVDRLAREIKAFPKAEGIERIYVPGEMEFEEAQKVRVRGLVLDEATTNSLRELAQDLELNEAFESIFAV